MLLPCLRLPGPVRSPIGQPDAVGIQHLTIDGVCFVHNQGGCEEDLPFIKLITKLHEAVKLKTDCQCRKCQEQRHNFDTVDSSEQDDDGVHEEQPHRQIHNQQADREQLVSAVLSKLTLAQHIDGSRIPALTLIPETCLTV